MQVIYTRISDANYEWLKENADNSGLSMTRIIDDMLTETRENGLSVAPVRAQARFTKKEKKDARSGTQVPQD